MTGPNGDGSGGDVIKMAVAREAQARKKQASDAAAADAKKQAHMDMLEQATHKPVLPAEIDQALDDVRNFTMNIRTNFDGEQPPIQHPIGAMEIDLTRLKMLAVTAGAPPIGNLLSIAANAVYALASYYTMRDAYRETRGETDGASEETAGGSIGGADSAGSGDVASVGVRHPPDIHPEGDGPVDEVSG